DSLMRSKVSAAGPALMPGSRAMVTQPSSTVNVPGASGQVDSWSSQCSPTTLSQPKGFASAEFRESRQVFHSVTNWNTWRDSRNSALAKQRQQGVFDVNQFVTEWN